MLGLGDIWITAAVAGSVLVSVAGIIYGTLNWNNGGGDK